VLNVQFMLKQTVCIVTIELQILIGMLAQTVKFESYSRATEL